MQTSCATPNAFGNANPHALAVILEASETKSIIAATDIFDISGIKLWASKQPVSSALPRQLLDRHLRQPLESCLKAEDGVTGATLVRSLQELVMADSPLAPLLRPHAAKLVREASHLPTPCSAPTRPRLKPWKTSSASVCGVCSAPLGCWPANCPPPPPTP